MNPIERIISSARESGDAARERARRATGTHSEPRLGGALLAGLAGALAGAAGAFLLDPARGRARRAQFRDQAAAAVRRLVRGGEGAVGRARSEIEGRAAALRASTTTHARPVDDATLTDRVRSIAFRDASLDTSTLNVNVERGIVVLRGEVPDDSTRTQLVRDVERIDGVWSVRDLLHLPGEAAPTTTVAS